MLVATKEQAELWKEFLECALDVTVTTDPDVVGTSGGAVLAVLAHHSTGEGKTNFMKHGG